MNMLKSKTVWAGIVGIVTAIGGYYTGDLSAGAALNAALTGTVAVFLRAGMEKGG